MRVRASTFTVFLLGMAAPAAGQDAQPLLVSPDWVAERLADPSLRIFHIGERETYDARHIKGAQFLSLQSLSTTQGDLSLEMLEGGDLQDALRERGISNDSRIVLYWSDEWVTATSRAFVTLEYAGLEGRVSILDGGFEGWVSRGNPTTDALPTVARGSVTVQLHPEVLATADWINSERGRNRVAVIDARDEVFYNGTRPTRNPRQGRIPGARSIPFNSLTTDSLRLLPLETIRAAFREAGATPEGAVVTYCHIGQQATWVYFVAKVIGLKPKLYDGSWQEWSARSDLPVENPAASKDDGL